MSPERRQMVRNVWGSVLTFVRNWLAIILGIYFAIVGGHGALVHERDLHMPDVFTMSLGVLSIFGWHGLCLWRDILTHKQEVADEART